MEWTTFFIWLAVLVFLFDFDLLTAVIVLAIIGALMSDPAVNDELSNELDNLKIEIDTMKNKDLVFPPAKPVTLISVKNYDDVGRVYISNSERHFEFVSMKTLAGKTYACRKDDTCIIEPTMKRHIDDVLYACKNDTCYPVQ